MLVFISYAFHCWILKSMCSDLLRCECRVGSNEASIETIVFMWVRTCIMWVRRPETYWCFTSIEALKKKKTSIVCIRHLTSRVCFFSDSLAVKIMCPEHNCTYALDVQGWFRLAPLMCFSESLAHFKKNINLLAIVFSDSRACSHSSFNNRLHVGPNNRSDLLRCECRKEMSSF